MIVNTTFCMDGTVFIPHQTSEEFFTIHSSPRPYTVTCNDDIDPINEINKILLTNKKNVLIIDKQVFSIYGDRINILHDQVFVAEACENFKTMDGVNHIIDFLYQRQFGKSETLVIVGGGIIQDISGFIAAIYKRGVKWIFFPTTLLAMCDSCIGAKTGINYDKAKNQIGLFAAPSKIIINFHFLKTLHQKDISSGLGEILKLCVIGGDRFLKLYSEQVKHGQVLEWEDYKSLILSALSVKKAVIEVDEFENHLRNGLNYGHTIGHIIEVLSDYQIPHGSAVVIGMLIINELAYKKSYLNVEDKIYLNQLCSELISDNVISIMQKISVDKILYLLKSDKKVEGNKIKFIIPKKIGELCFVKFEIDDFLKTEIVSILTAIFKNTN